MVVLKMNGYNSIAPKILIAFISVNVHGKLNMV
jgi:hypothetical protein